MNSIDIINRAIDHWSSRTSLSSHHLRAALIDMDGTLYDSMPNHTASWYRLMTENGIDCTRDEFYLYEGCTGADTIRRLWKRQFNTVPSDDFISEMYHRKTLYFNQLERVSPMPGADAMIRTFRSHGIDTVLVTGSGQPSVLDRLDTDFPGAFPHDKRVTARNVTQGKPSPEPYLKGMELAGIDPSGAMVIENAPVGALAGVRSRAFTVAIMTGPIDRREFEAVGADLIIESMPEFVNILPDLIQSLK